jgi:hypothetical protein
MIHASFLHKRKLRLQLAVYLRFAFGGIAAYKESN